MNKFSSRLLFLFLLHALLANAQEREYDLFGNRQIVRKKSVESKSNQASVINKSITLFLKDTTPLAIPLVDDFSSDKFTTYDASKYPASAKSSGIRYSFRVNGLLRDSINYITDTAYTYSYNAQTNLLDSVKIATPNFVLDVYDDFINPTIATATFNAWLPYYKPVYDTLVDTLLYEILVKLDTTRFLEIDSITYIDTHSYPIPTLWYENQVFRNANYPINPPSIGVATFDGLDSTGYPYNFKNPFAYGLADQLTSKYINLSAPLGSNDSLLLTFYYQPKGLGNTPESTDSLILDFKASDGSWNHVWSTPGRPLLPDTAFTKVEIRIKNSEYLFNGFQFRFKNYATLSGNLDHWHLDYVRLKKITAPSDLVINDIAFVYPSASFLKDYFAVPFSQYDSSMMKPNVQNTLVNLNNATLNFGFYSYGVNDHTGNTIANYTASGTTNILPSYPNGAPSSNFSFPIVTQPLVNFSYPDTLNSCRDFFITHQRSGTPDQITSNDNIALTQHITNYFAYDDASAESAYGVVQAGGQVALKFTINKADVLSGCYIYFNPAVDDATNKVFKLTVWSDAGGFPGSIYHQNAQVFSPKYTEYYNGFYKLNLDSALLLQPGNYYMGWVQSTANEINVGLDKKNNHSDKLFFNLGSGWLQSIVTGSLMLHPVLGDCPTLYIGIPEKINIKADEVSFYPNPADDKISFTCKEQFLARVSIFDVSGKLICQKNQMIAESLDISAIEGGVYFLKIENPLKSYHTTKKLVVLH